MKISAAVLIAFYVMNSIADFAFPDFQSVEGLAMQARFLIRVVKNRFNLHSYVRPARHLYSRTGSRKPILGKTSPHSVDAGSFRIRLAYR
jgi:hypothetical protein